MVNKTQWKNYSEKGGLGEYETEHLTGTEAANRCRWQMSGRLGDRWSRQPGLVAAHLLTFRRSAGHDFLS